MFEFDVGKEIKKSPADSHLSSMFDVCSGKTGAEFHNDYKHVKANSDGFRGLSTTLIKTGLPISLWNAQSHIGLLLDGGNEDCVKTVFVSPRDAGSQVEMDHCLVKGDPKNPILALQGFTEGCDCLSINLNQNVDHHIALAKKAMPLLWEQIHEKARLEKNGMLGLNEAIVNAHAKGIIGLVVYQNPFVDGHIADLGHRQHMEEVKALQNWLCQHYPEIFPAGLPIYIYSPAKGLSEYSQPSHVHRPM